jgi:hypothetical protein
MLLQMGLQILLPAVLIVSLWRAHPKNKPKWFLDTLVSLMFILFVFVSARWDMTSYYLRFFVIILCIIAGYRAFHRIYPERSKLPMIDIIKGNLLNIILIGVVGWLNYQAISGKFYAGEAVDLAFPLQDGVYYVGGGGTSRWLNNHYGFPTQTYALDIVRLNTAGRSGDILGQNDLGRYAIYGDPIYSPCAGPIVDVVDGLPDQLPPNKDSVNVAGNYVLMMCNEVEILLAHMKQGSIAVATGDVVQVGDKIGAVGNSGNTSQPHLHIHAEQGGKAGAILNGKGIPITFRGRFFVRNDLVMSKEPAK